ncbi:MAG: GlcG/HbpS family heme-binding protein [Acetobacteraceae bacterium]
MRKWFIVSAAFMVLSTSAWAQGQNGQDQNAQGQNFGTCGIPRTTIQNLQNQLSVVANPTNYPDDNGSLFKPNPGRWWSAIVDRKGVLCSVTRSDPDAWPGSRSIAIAKASTANDFSNNLLALSTANLYALTQPGVVPGVTGMNGSGSLWGLNNSNPFNPLFQMQGTGIGFVPGGIITFGGGVPLYSGGQVIGGLGLSGDSACADHAAAFRMRQRAGLDGTPNSDNIQYAGFGVVPTGFQHPHCSGTSASNTNDITP